MSVCLVFISRNVPFKDSQQWVCRAGEWSNNEPILLTHSNESSVCLWSFFEPCSRGPKACCMLLVLYRNIELMIIMFIYSRTQLTASATIYPFLKTSTYVCNRLREDGHLRMYQSSRRRSPTYVPVFAKTVTYVCTSLREDSHLRTGTNQRPGQFPGR